MPSTQSQRSILSTACAVAALLSACVLVPPGTSTGDLAAVSSDPPRASSEYLYGRAEAISPCGTWSFQPLLKLFLNVFTISPPCGIFVSILKIFRKFTTCLQLVFDRTVGAGGAFVEAFY